MNLAQERSDDGDNHNNRTDQREDETASKLELRVGFARRLDNEPVAVTANAATSTRSKQQKQEKTVSAAVRRLGAQRRGATGDQKYNSPEYPSRPRHDEGEYRDETCKFLEPAAVP